MIKILPSLVFLIGYLQPGAQIMSSPHLEKKGNAIQLIVQGKPFLVRGGELHNSSTSTAEYMRGIWKKMADKNLNTVITAVYWEMVEPIEGKFNFVLVDSMLAGARQQNLHLVLLWFGSWKNGYSTYPPTWVKKDFVKYPRAKDKNGKSFQMLSTFGESSAKADAAAFGALMQHIKEVDEHQQTVIAAQVENEMGLFGSPRDYTDAASKAFAAPVPGDLMKYLSTHKNDIQPEIDSAWKANGYKTSGSWEDVFGKSVFDKTNWKALSYLPEELFTVYHYAKYVGTVAAEGKKAYAIPMYVNAWIKQDIFGYPGRYPSGGPIPHTMDVWRAVAPALDFIAPDIYIKDALYTILQYRRKGNPVFIPEFRPGLQSASEALWAYGEAEAICFSPFGIDDIEAADDPITKTYAGIAQMQNLILQQHGRGTMHGIYMDTISKGQEFDLGGYRVTAQKTGGISTFAGFTIGSKSSPFAGGIVINSGKDEFVVIGKDFSLSFTPLQMDDSTLDVEYLEEGHFVNDQWVMTRKLNGDEGTGGGDYGFGFGNPRKAALRFPVSPTGDYTIVKMKIYKYK